MPWWRQGMATAEEHIQTVDHILNMETLWSQLYQKTFIAHYQAILQQTILLLRSFFFFFFVRNPDICISVELHAFSLAQDTNLIKTFLSILTVGSDTSYTHSLRSPLSLTFPKIKVIHFQLLISFQWLFTGVSQQAQDPGRTDVGEHSTTTQGSSPFHKSKSRPRIHLLFKQNTGKIKSDGRDIIRHLWFCHDKP